MTGRTGSTPLALNSGRHVSAGPTLLCTDIGEAYSRTELIGIGICGAGAGVGALPASRLMGHAVASGQAVAILRELMLVLAHASGVFDAPKGFAAYLRLTAFRRGRKALRRFPGQTDWHGGDVAGGRARTAKRCPQDEPQDKADSCGGVYNRSPVQPDFQRGQCDDDAHDQDADSESAHGRPLIPQAGRHCSEVRVHLIPRSVSAPLPCDRSPGED